MTEHQDEVREQEQIRVIVCRPMEKAEVIEIGDDLRSMQETVGGMIEEYIMTENPSLAVSIFKELSAGNLKMIIFH